MLLHDGVPPASVVDGLDDMVRRLEGVTGADGWSQARDAYLVVLEAPRSVA
jgi:hypothetical protein